MLRGYYGPVTEVSTDGAPRRFDDAEVVSTPAPMLIPRPPDADRGVVIATRHPAMRRALWAVVEGTRGVAPLGAAGDLPDTMRLVLFTHPELVLVDTSVLGGPGLAGLATLKAGAPAARIVVIGAGDHPAYAAQAREAGAFDYVVLDDAAERVPEAILAATSALQP
jgi:DNA-binding NarL/FixJ family response regulator